MPRIWKQVIAPGTYWVRGSPYTCTSADVAHFERVGKEMLAEGLPVRVPFEHLDYANPLDDNARRAKDVLYNKGFVGAYRTDADGSLWAGLDIGDSDPTFINRLESEIKYVSPRILPEFTDGTGKRYQNCIAHVALTAQPVWHGQKPFGQKPSFDTAGTDGASANGVALSLANALVRGPVDLSLAAMVTKTERGWELAAADESCCPPPPAGYGPMEMVACEGHPQVPSLSKHPHADASPALCHAFHSDMADYHEAAAKHYESTGDPELANAHKSVMGYHQDMAAGHGTHEMSNAGGPDAALAGKPPADATHRHTTAAHLAGARYHQAQAYGHELSTGHADPSFGAVNMSDEKEDDLGTDEAPAEAHDELPSVADHFESVKEMLAEPPFDIKLPEHCDEASAWEHLYTALMNKKGGEEDKSEEERDDEKDEKEAVPEPTMVSMSAADRSWKTELEGRIARADRRAAAAELHALTSEIDRQVRRGALTSDKAASWKQILTQKQLSLVADQPARDVQRVLDQLALATEMPDHSVWDNRQLTGTNLSQEETPNWHYDADQKAQKETLDEMLAMANRGKKK